MPEYSPIIDYRDPIHKSILLTELFDNYSKFNLRDNLKKELKTAGIIWINGEDTPPEKASIKDRNAELKDVRKYFYTEALLQASKNSKQYKDLDIKELKTLLNKFRMKKI